jgi:serine protease AprX
VTVSRPSSSPCSGCTASRVDLLLVPHKDSSAGELLAALRERLDFDPREHRLAYNEGYVVVRLSLLELVLAVVSLSKWWRDAGEHERRWFYVLLGRLDPHGREQDGEEALEEIGHGLAGDPADAGAQTPLWNVALNRELETTLWRSRLTAKADAAQRVFAVDCSRVRWAIVDSGIDARHPAFRRRDEASGTLLELEKDFGESTRVVATYDFSRLRPLLAEGGEDEIADRIERGMALDWDALKPRLEIRHNEDYQDPPGEHGTHVAGIVGADWRTTDEPRGAIHDDLVGVCPDIELYDLRVFGPNREGDEFGFLAALQFIRHLNAHSDLQVIHGANLSLAHQAYIANYAIGRTPICDECERLTASGVIVAAAAGNEGRARYAGPDGRLRDGFRSVAITDPGNAESVITVGATHGGDPHTYGVSYFSSRGPTGDGRAKPDLVAPGEKIESPVPGGRARLQDGTSQATAHVSGVAAMLIARNRELAGQPQRVKEILCATATDLGREHYFQGSGLIDALRALQEV